MFGYQNVSLLVEMTFKPVVVHTRAMLSPRF